MRAGKLRHKIMFLTRSETRDDEGGTVYTYEDDWEAWAKVSPLKGRELVEAQQNSEELTHKVTVRGRPDKTITTDQQFRFNNQVYIVTGPPVDVDERGIVVEFGALFLNDAPVYKWVANNHDNLVTHDGDRIVFV